MDTNGYANDDKGNRMGSKPDLKRTDSGYIEKLESDSNLPSIHEGLIPTQELRSSSSSNSSQPDQIQNNKEWAYLVSTDPSIPKIILNCDKNKYIFGRNSEECDVELKGNLISRRHFCIDAFWTEKNRPIVTIKDLRSTNKTYLNGECITPPLPLKENDPLNPIETEILRDGDIISIGNPDDDEYCMTFKYHFTWAGN